MSGALVTGFVLVLLALQASPAVAVDDPTRPDGHVTYGPSCRPGGLVIEVVAGSVPYFVRLSTTRQPDGEDEATVSPGSTVTLRTGDVAWGETIDGRLEYEARDGSGVAFVDDLDTYSFTRPAQEDCAAIAAPVDAEAPSAAPPAAGVLTPVVPAAQTPSPVPVGSSDTLAGAAAPSVPAGRAANTSAPGPVLAGGLVTLVGVGFLPGERVTIAVHGSDDVLGTGTAGPDGTVQIDVRLPSGIAAGPATMDLFGHRSETVADVQLQVAAHDSGVGDAALGDLVPLTAAAAALVASVAGLVSVAGRQRALGRGTPLRRA